VRFGGQEGCVSAAHRREGRAGVSGGEVEHRPLPPRLVADHLAAMLTDKPNIVIAKPHSRIRRKPKAAFVRVDRAHFRLSLP